MLLHPGLEHLGKDDQDALKHQRLQDLLLSVSQASAASDRDPRAQSLEPAQSLMKTRYLLMAKLSETLAKDLSGIGFLLLITGFLFPSIFIFLYLQDYKPHRVL